MTTISAPMSSFDALDDPHGSDLLAAAAAATTHAVEDSTVGPLVIVVRPLADDRQVLAGGGNSVLRAAVSVAADAERERLWADAPTGSTAQVEVRTLPEVLRTAAQATGATSVHMGCVDTGELDCVAMWFETPDGIAGSVDRQTTLGVLASAAVRDRDRRAAAPVVVEVVDEPAERRFDPNDPDIDAVTGVPNRQRFEEILFDFEGDEATLLLIDLDDFETVRDDMGGAIADGVLRTVADRLCESTRRNDAISYLGDSQFAVLFGTAARHDAMQVAKRLISLIAEPISVEGIDVAVTATVAFAHQVGLVDLEDMMESADEAVASGKRSGPGRLILAV